MKILHLSYFIKIVFFRGRVKVDFFKVDTCFWRVDLCRNRISRLRSTHFDWGYKVNKEQ